MPLPPSYVLYYALLTETLHQEARQFDGFPRRNAGLARRNLYLSGGCIHTFYVRQQKSAKRTGFILNDDAINRRIKIFKRGGLWRSQNINLISHIREFVR
jgi:hypothetical protein